MKLQIKHAHSVFHEPGEDITCIEVGDFAKVKNPAWDEPCMVRIEEIDGEKLRGKRTLDGLQCEFTTEDFALFAKKRYGERNNNYEGRT